jgi:hypothetical protein
VRILVQMPFSGYLRHYGSMIRLLSERGHQVLIAYDSPDKRRDPSAAVVESSPGVELVASVPAAKRRFERGIGSLRLSIDYVRYLDRRFAGSPYLRRRLEKYLRSPFLKPLARLPYGVPFARASLRGLLAVERRVPSDGRVERAIAAHDPDVVFVSPLLGRSNGNRRQTDTVKAAHALQIPVGAGIATWDNLTTKGLIKAWPDALLVWNEIQARDAAELHFVPRERIVVTGAPLFDGWFGRRATVERAEFTESIGLERAAHYVLYVGSSPNIVSPELEIPFVRGWLEAVCSGSDLAVLVRPHPYSVEAWAEVDLGERAEVAPRIVPALPMTEGDEALYFHSLHFSEAVVGINTTAMVEAFVVGKPVLTITSPEFRETQEATLHFGNLRSAAGGALQQASTIEEHLEQLRATRASPDSYREGIEGFLRTFVRPLGLDRSATEAMCDELERLGGSRRSSRSRPAAVRA